MTEKCIVFRVQCSIVRCEGDVAKANRDAATMEDAYVLTAERNLDPCIGALEEKI